MANNPKYAAEDYELRVKREAKKHLDDTLKALEQRFFAAEKEFEMFKKNPSRCTIDNLLTFTEYMAVFKTDVKRFLDRKPTLAPEWKFKSARWGEFIKHVDKILREFHGDCDCICERTDWGEVIQAGERGR